MWSSGENQTMQVYPEARVVVITDASTGERLTLRFPSGIAFSQFVRRTSGVTPAEATATALQFAASGRACLARESRAPRRFQWARLGPSRN
jgi:hypothetical protein